MAEAFLESSIVIGLHFRNARERARCLEAIPAGSECITSRYVVYEVARGFLRNLLLLHNVSFEFRSFSELHEAAHSGQVRFKPYRMQTWLGAFDDYFAALEAEGGILAPSAALAEVRAKLRTWARRGWSAMMKSAPIINPIGCREDLRPPFVRSHDKHLHQELPTTECGKPSACGLQRYLFTHASSLNGLLTGLRSMPARARDAETIRLIGALERLLAIGLGATFVGKDCWTCGDAFIAHEAPSEAIVVTKNRQHFEPLCGLLEKKSAFPL